MSNLPPVPDSDDVGENLRQVSRPKENAGKSALDAWYSQPADPVPPAPFRTIGIVGAGVMGSGIAHWCAAHGYGVILCDTNKAAIESGVALIRELFADGVRRGKVSADDAHRMTGGVGITTSLEDFEFCDLVIETISEDLAAKQKLFAELSAVTKPDCVLASNSSALPIKEIAAQVTNPGRTVGLHFFNPVSRIPLVELALSPHTTRATADRVLALVKTMDKTPVICGSSPGNFVSRVIFFYLNEACCLWEQEGLGIASLDRVMKDWGWPMGPMRLIDEIGLDVTEAVWRELTHYFPGRFIRSNLCRQMLDAGFSGRKNGAGHGFYTYAEGSEIPNPAVAQFTLVSAGSAPVWPDKAIQDHLNRVLVDETKRVLAEGVIKTSEDADLAFLLGLRFPAVRGSLSHYTQEIGR